MEEAGREGKMTAIICGTMLLKLWWLYDLITGRLYEGSSSADVEMCAMTGSASTPQIRGAEGVF